MGSGISPSKYRADIEALAQSWLAGYTSSLSPDVVPKQRKEFNDSLWGTISLYPTEVVVLDSPLVQRLRLIKQLGVVHWIYPGATHTRLEHVLGATHQVTRLVRSINDSIDKEAIDYRLERALRLTALCHDVGHGAMSHVSENALRRDSDVEELRMAFVDEHAIEKASLSEIAAFYLIGSPSFRGLVKQAQALTGDSQYPEDLIEMMQSAIIGRAISDHIPLLHELISGPFDADKLDYMPRDARMCGVPVVTDIDRLIQKARAVPVTEEELPPEVARTVKGGNVAYIMTGVALSGGRTLDELMLGRTLLFDKIYRHQKVRTIESMVSSLFLSSASILGDKRAIAPLILSDDSILSIDEQVLGRLKGSALNAEEAAAASVAADLAKRLRERRLFVRAFAFSQNMPLDSYRFEQQQRLGLERLIRDTKDARRRSTLLTTLADEIALVLKAIGKLDLLDAFPSRDPKPFLWIDPPESPTRGNDIPRAFLVAADRQFIRFKDDAAETRAWADAYLLAGDIGYIFAPAELAPYVFLAAQKIAREQYDVKLPSTMLLYAKQRENRLEEIRITLEAANYYAASPTELRPLPGRLRRADVRKRLDVIAQRFAGYTGPNLDDSLKSRIIIDKDRLRNWLRQFPNEKAIDAAFTVLEKTRLVGRAEVNRALKEFMTKHPEFRGANLCPLGAPKDSAAVTSYYAGDLAARYDLTLTTLSNALASGDKPIVFVDDYVGTGCQSITIVESWLALPRTCDLNEEREALPTQLRETFQRRAVGFVFAAGTDSGTEKLLTRAREIFPKVAIHAGIRESDLPRAFDDGTFKSVVEEEAALKVFSNIGRQLFEGDPKRDDRALGYGNKSLLVVFPYNTPTATLAALWKDGVVDGRAWMPLFPRRKKR